MFCGIPGRTGSGNDWYVCVVGTGDGRGIAPFMLTVQIKLQAGKLSVSPMVIL